MKRRVVNTQPPSSLSFSLFFLCCCALLCTLSLAAYTEQQEADYLANFDVLISKSYSAPRPSSLSQCVSAGNISKNIQTVFISSNVDSQGLVNACGTDKLCVINAGVTVSLNGNVNVAAIINKGIITWTDATQRTTQQFLCAGYIVTEDNGIFNLSLSDSSKSAFIYIKDNNAFHPQVGYRVFGGSHSNVNSLPGYPIVELNGSKVRRTWTLLSKTAKINETYIRVMHDVKEMGWKEGDRIVISTTGKGSNGVGQGGLFIKSIDGNRINLATTASLSTDAVINQEYLGDVDSYMQAEVMLMSRNVIITGDDFKQVPCGEGTLCPCRFPGEVCTAGLHTIINGNNTRFGGTYRIQNTRVEKCGQRGVIGRYCIHFHAVRECPNCLADGNAIEYSHQRGVVVHNTHMATVTHNTLHDVRGAGIYIEDGNELYNHVEYNSVFCPHAFEGPQQGCTLPGTDNGEADTALNQAAYWSLSHTNHFIGNRAANSFNGIFFHPSFASGGRAFSLGKMCTNFLPLGRVVGNTCHGHGRFGTYFVSSDWPRKVHTNFSINGWSSTEECAPFDLDGFDRGLPATIWNNVDYHNVFVGGYALGDVQFRNHVAKDSNCLIYHKETKNFADGCSAHFKNYQLEDGTANLASGLGTQLFEDCTFKGNFAFESNHHCNQGVSGVLCNPQYIFINPTWEVTSSKFLTWNDGDNPTHGSTYSLSPPDAANPKSTMFPRGFQSACHGHHTYLLQLDNGATCVTADSLGMARKYENGILCKKPLRRLEIFTQGLDYGTSGSITLQVSQNGRVVAEQDIVFMVIRDDRRKQGFSIPVVASLDYQYRLVRSGGVPKEWIIEFSDPVIGNRWEPDRIHLQVDGRTCPDITTSQHDRRFIWASSDDSLKVTGRGACTSYPDMPAVQCSNVKDIELMNCPELCANCNGPNQYCDCGSGQCMCDPGFSGPDCKVDICASSRCGHGECTARFLGGDVPVTEGACRCKEPYVGVSCDANPCTSQTCSGHGECHTIDENSFRCECDVGYSGPTCNTTCLGYCTGEKGVWPFGCNGGMGTASFCGGQNNGQGCSYDSSLLQKNTTWCCFAFCNLCNGVVCEDASIEGNDCMLSPKCESGKCITATRAEGSVCHSKDYGTCKSGVCVAGTPPSSPSTSTSTSTGSVSVSTTQASTTGSFEVDSGVGTSSSWCLMLAVFVAFVLLM